MNSTASAAETYQVYGYAVMVGWMFLLVPALFLAIALRPRPFINIMRGSEAGAYIAALALGVRWFTLILTNGAPIPYPGDVWALISICGLAIPAALCWMRVHQMLRHRARNRDTQREWLRQLAEREKK